MSFLFLLLFMLIFYKNNKFPAMDLPGNAISRTQVCNCYTIPWAFFLPYSF